MPRLCAVALILLLVERIAEGLSLAPIVVACTEILGENEPSISTSGNGVPAAAIVRFE